MKQTFTLMFFVVFSIALFAQETARETIDKINADIEKCMTTGNFGSSIEYYADDAVSLPSYAPMIKGKKAIEAQSEADKEMVTKFNKFELETVEVTETGDYAIEIGTYIMEFEMPGMPEMQSDKGKYITIYQKIDNTWKIKYEMWNTDINPMESMPSDTDSQK